MKIHLPIQILKISMGIILLLITRRVSTSSMILTKTSFHPGSENYRTPSGCEYENHLLTCIVF